MSYDFKPTYHIGMTPAGYYQGGVVRQKKYAPPIRTNPFKDLRTVDLRSHCEKGDQLAIEEWSYRSSTGSF